MDHTARRHVYMVMELRIFAKMSLNLKEVKQPRVQRQRERDKYAELTMENNSFVHFARGLLTLTFQQVGAEKMKTFRPVLTSRHHC